MDQTLSVVAAMVSLSGAGITQQTVEQALKAAGLVNVEVTWRCSEGDEDHWHVTVATGQRVAAGALPSHRQTADDLAALLLGLLRA